MPVEIQTHPWYHQRHHRAEGGFGNVWDVPRDAPFLKSARWLLARPFSQHNKANVPPPVHHLDAPALGSPSERLRITWLGHAATLIQTPHQTLLTDPMLSRRASPLSFAGPPRQAILPLRLEELPPIDVVLLSHDHYDHLDQVSIRAIQRHHTPLFLAPLGAGAILRRWGATRVAELDWWQYADVEGVRYHCTPAMHFSGRGPTNRDGTLWCGWYVETDVRARRTSDEDGRPGKADVRPNGALIRGGRRAETDVQAGAADDADGADVQAETDPASRAGQAVRTGAVYFAGDSGYAGLFGAIRERLGAPEVALLPIGAYRPRWFMKPVHMDPEEAVRAFTDVGAAHLIPVHWGTFDLADEPIQEPAARVQIGAREAGVADRLHVLDIGTAFTPERTSTPLPASGAS